MRHTQNNYITYKYAIMEEKQLEWEEGDCIWCGSVEYDYCFEGPDRLERLPGTFCLIRCRHCGVYRQNPRLSWNALMNYYPDNYVSYYYQNNEKNNRWQKYINNYGNIKRRKAVERFQSGGRLLDVGCGTGAFLQELIRSKKWDVIGIEPNKKAAEYAQLRTNATIYNDQFYDTNLDPDSFDAIALWTVLEHLEQPIRDLKYAHNLLKGNGWLILSIPNINSLGAKIFKEYWSGWDLPRHLYLFPPSTLREILESIGFCVVYERCLSTSYQALGHSIDFWSQQWEKKFPKLKNILMRIYYSWVTRIGLLIPLAILDRLNLTSTITVFARKC